MQVIIYAEYGEAFAEWIDECGTEHEKYLGEVSEDWLENKAEVYFSKLLGEEITIELVFNR